MITRNPKVSVLMPVYNTREEYLREAIDSILGQTYTDYEFIIINDGSDNNAKDVILSYNDARIKYYEQCNQGIIAALNRGISLCNGEYIARMDSDDIALPERFRKQVEILDSDGKIGVVGTWISRFPENIIVKTDERPRFLECLRTCPVAHPTVMIRREVLHKNRLRYRQCMHAEDYDLWSRMIKCTEFYNIQEVLLKYRVHDTSISAKNALAQLENTKGVQKHMLEFLTADEELQRQIFDVVAGPHVARFSPLDMIFSIKIVQYHDRKKVIFRIGGIKVSFKRKIKAK